MYNGHILTITQIIFKLGSDTKLVGQMQPYYEAKTRGKQQLGDTQRRRVIVSNAVYRP